MTIVCVCALTAISSNAQSTTSSSASVEYYGRYALSLEPNAQALLYAYDQIYEGVEASKDTIKIYDEKHPISADELYTVFDAYTRDHTEQFWLGNSYSYSYTSTTVIEFMPNYLMSGNKLATAKVAFEKAVNTFLAELNGSMSDFERELILHDKLAKTVTYVESSNAHNAYGAIVEGKAVCEGYAEALQYLLHRAGIQSFIAVGASVNPSNGASEGHAWNYVKIDGKYYHTDVTWNDQGSTTYHAYFNQSDAVIQVDHSITATDYVLPKCNSTIAQYFNVMDGKIAGTDYSVTSVADLLKNNGLQAILYIQDDSVSGFVEWMKDNVAEIAQKAGVIGAFKYSYSYLGKELHLTIRSSCDHDNMTQVSAIQATCTKNGNVRYYICSCGRWFSDSAGKKEIIDRDSVIVNRLGHSYTEQIADSAHLKLAADNCQSMNIYWLDCSRCSSNAKNDAMAQDKYYTGTIAGNHIFMEKIADQTHLVAGSGADCKHVKRYYYDCANCNQMGTTIWDSTTYGAHRMSDQWTTDSGYHYRICTVGGCSHIEEKAKCSGGAASCTELAKCAYCQQSYGKLAEHQYENWCQDANQHWKECKHCGYQDGRADHQPNSVLESNEVAHWNACMVCYQRLQQTPHVYDDTWKMDGTDHWQECKCGAQTNKSVHIDDNENGFCDVCQYNCHSNMDDPMKPTPSTPSTPSTPPQTSEDISPDSDNSSDSVIQTNEANGLGWVIICLAGLAVVTMVVIGIAVATTKKFSR
jgi:hypothetical protein